MVSGGSPAGFTHHTLPERPSQHFPNAKPSDKVPFFQSTNPMEFKSQERMITREIVGRRA